MATRRKNTGGAQAPAQDENGEVLADDAAQSPEDRLAEYFGGAAADDVRVSIYEVQAEGREHSFLFAFAISEAPPADALFEQILQTYGPGRYEAIGRDATNNRYVFRQRFRLGSERDLRRRQLVPETGASQSSSASAQPAQPAQSAPSSQLSGLSPELAAVLEQQNRILEKLTESLAGGGGGRGRDTIEVMREIAELKTLFQPQPTQDLLKTVTDVLSLKERFQGETAGENPLTAAVQSLAPLLRDAVGKLQAQQGAGAPAGPPAAPPESAGAAGEGSTPRAEPNGDAMPGLRNALAPLVELAEQQTPAPMAAEAVFRVLAEQPEWIESAVLTFLETEREAAAARLVATEPKLADHREWLEAVVSAVVSALEPAGGEDAGGDDSGGEDAGAQAQQPANAANGAPDGNGDGARNV